MIISVTGSFGVGKTTLAVAIAKKLGSRLIDEDFRGIAEAGNDFNKARGNPALQKEKLTNLYCACDNWLRSRSAWVKSDENLVLDRCCFDILQRYVSNLFDEEIVRNLIEHCKNESLMYDLVIVPSICDWSNLSHKNNDGLIRANSSTLQLRDHLMTIGLLNSYCPSKMLLIPPQISSIDDRVNFVLKTLNKF
jgi:predicted ATPase